MADDEGAEGMLVHVIDDDDLVRDSLEMLLQAEGFEVAAFASAADFLAFVNVHTRGCVVTDVQLPGMSGIDLIAALRQRGVALPVIVITAHANLALAVEAMKRGASDFIQKPYSADALIGAIRGACANVGHACAESPELVATRENLAKLTAREREVLLKLVNGLPNKLIAYDMGLSVRTVDSHRAALKKKMGGANLAELVRRCMAIGFVSAQTPGAGSESSKL
jgi:two-component system response regulator FixJ